MERFLDLLFGIRWWQWLLGTAVVAGLYYLVVGVICRAVRDMRMDQEEEERRQRMETEEEQKKEQARQRKAERERYLKSLPSGPVGEVHLPPAALVGQQRRVPIRPDAETLLGTSRDVTVPIMRRGVSREHAKIRPQKEGYVLYDLRSLTGTFVNGERIERKALADGDVVRIGPLELEFRLEEPQAEEEGGPAT
jgi:pSer/pThr/pTyr-binding forkhead associated (FHA) protein